MPGSSALGPKRHDLHATSALYCTVVELVVAMGIYSFRACSPGPSTLHVSALYQYCAVELVVAMKIRCFRVFGLEYLMQVPGSSALEPHC